MRFMRPVNLTANGLRESFSGNLRDEYLIA
jgi:hypothetical protein